MTNPHVLVSVVVPVFNAEQHIATTLNSVLSQTYQNLEILVIDDCSTDGTLSVVSEIAFSDDRIKITSLATNMGAPAGPRNIGIDRAKGLWIAFLDADDIWHPNKLELQLALLERTGASFCSSAAFNFVLEDDFEFDQELQFGYEKITFLKQLIRFRTPTASVLVLSSVAKETLFNESIDYKAREDVDCWLRVHEKIPFSIKTKMQLMAYRVIDGQISGNKFTMIKRHLHVLKNYRTLAGHSLGPLAYICTMSHFILSIIPRFILRKL